MVRDLGLRNNPATNSTDLDSLLAQVRSSMSLSGKWLYAVPATLYTLQNRLVPDAQQSAVWFLCGPLLRQSMKILRRSRDDVSSQPVGFLILAGDHSTLRFEALQRISPPEYQLLNNMKLFTTSLVFRVAAGPADVLGGHSKMLLHFGSPCMSRLVVRSALVWFDHARTHYAFAALPQVMQRQLRVLQWKSWLACIGSERLECYRVQGTRGHA